MVNPFNPDTISDGTFAIITSIIKRKGASITEMAIDTKLSDHKIRQLIAYHKREGHIYLNSKSRKYYLAVDLWNYWIAKGFGKKIPQGDRSIWLHKSPVRDWYPSLSYPKPNLVYYIGPYQEPFLTIYRDLIKPVVEVHGLVCETAIDDPGSEEFLRNKILPSLLNSRFVICDLSTSNANVHYELGWLHALGTPFLAFTSRERPSDIHHLTINQYQCDAEGLQALSDLIRSSLYKNEIISTQICTNLDFTEISRDISDLREI